MKKILCNIRGNSVSFDNRFKGIFVIALALVISINTLAHTGNGSPWNSDFTCTAHITSLYFNKLDGGADIPITNGATFTSAQLGSLYNLEAGTSGTVGSVKFIITGPSSSSNIENSAPYNSPATGSGPWIGSAGNYSVRIKAYSLSNAGGSICHDTTITFIIANDCSCPNNLLTNGSFENSASGWTVSGGSLTFGTGYVMCGSYNGFLNWSSGTAKVWQEVAVSAGSTVNFKGYAGTHNPGLACSPKLSLIFYNSSNTVISQSDAAVTFDVGSGNQLALYTINATAPAGTVKVRVQGSITCNTLKVDGFCLTVTPTTLTLGNQVWQDLNGNGILNAGEPGIANVSVKLYNDANNDNVADGAAAATTTTNSSGNYSFSGLSAGNYIVGVVIPNGFLSSTVNGGDPDNDIDNDDNGQVASGNEVRGLAITLSLGGEPGSSSVNNTYDFGLINDCDCIAGTGNLLTNGSFENTATGWSVSGGTLTFGTSYKMCGSYNGYLNWSSGTAKVWQDVTGIPVGALVNFKGYAGTHAPGLACSPKLSLIFLNSSNSVISQSDVVVTKDVGSGNQLELYTITAIVPAGTVKVRVQGSITCNTLKVDGFCLTAVTGSIGNFVWKDLNANGIQDAGEPGIPGVTVTLTKPDLTTVTTTTDANGGYLFSGLGAGTYSVAFTTPASHIPSPANAGSDDTKDSDPVSEIVSGIVLAAGENNTTVDAGYIPTINLSGNVWHDANALTDNEVNQTSAVPIPVGLRMYLINTSTGLVERSVIVSSATGTFSFNNINPNTTYRLILSSVSYPIGTSESTFPFVSIIPAPWEHTGQKNANPPNPVTGSDGVIDGKITVPIGVNSVININFGIRTSGGDVVQG